MKEELKKLKLQGIISAVIIILHRQIMAMNLNLS